MRSFGPSFRWLMISLAFLATAINYLDRQTLSVAAPVLMSQFHMTNEVYARVIFAFMLAYTIANGLSGPVIDRLGTRFGYALTMAWWSIADVLHVLARGPWSLGVYRFLLGIGEAGNWPASVKVVAEWFPIKERALASGIFNSGSAAGAILAPPLVVWLLLRYGWQEAFVWVGAVGGVWLIAWSLLYRTPDTVKAEVVAPKISAWKLFRTRFVWSFTLSKVFLDPVWYFYIFWFPEYLKAARHFSLASIGKYAWIPFAAAGIGNLIAGWFSAVLIKHNVNLNLARKGGLTVFALLMTCAIPAVVATDVYLSIAFVSLAMMGYTGCNAIMLSYPADVFPKNVVASIWGLASMGSGFGGMVFALLTGWVIDRFSYVPVFIGFGIMPLACAGIIWILLGPIATNRWNSLVEEVIR